MIEVLLLPNDGFPMCFNSGVGVCPAAMPPEVKNVLSESEWRQIVQAFNAESGCSVTAAVITLLLVPTFGLSYLFSYPHQLGKAWRINKKLRHISVNNVWQGGGAVGFQMSGRATDAQVAPESMTGKPKLWIKPPKIHI